MVELILYLEPENSSLLWEYVNEITSKYPTTATKYSCHVTMTGFFNTSNPSVIRDSLNQTMKAFRQLDTPVVSRPILVHEKEPLKAHLLLPVTVSDDYHRLLSAFKANCDSNIGLRLKKINHISLAYWDEPNATQNEVDIWLHFLQKPQLQNIIQEFDGGNIEKLTNWNIVLYQRTMKGEKVGEKHQFKELERWPIH